MLDLNTLVQLLTLVLLAVAVYVLRLLKTGTEAAVKTTAEEAAKAAIVELKWPAELGRELQKTRGIERQELRYESYGALWKELRPLAIYDTTDINKKTVGDLLTKLSDWYFSECGGLLLTPQARDFYFALQDLLRFTSTFPEDWDVDRPKGSERPEKEVLRDVLTARGTAGAISAFDYICADSFEDWEEVAAGHAKGWKDGVKKVAAAWNELDSRQRFATLQQVGSVLRTSLTNDLESRVR
jgi:hypothetical protein